MEPITHLLLAIQNELAEAVPEYDYLGKDWGQLTYANPPVSFPCGLLDVENIDYSNAKGGNKVGITSVTVTVGNMRLTSSASFAPDADEGYSILELVEKTCDALELFEDGRFEPLVLSNVRKVIADSGKEIYVCTFETAYFKSHDDGTRNISASGVKVVVNPE